MCRVVSVSIIILMKLEERMPIRVLWVALLVTGCSCSRLAFPSNSMDSSYLSDTAAAPSGPFTNNVFSISQRTLDPVTEEPTGQIFPSVYFKSISEGLNPNQNPSVSTTEIPGGTASITLDANGDPVGFAIILDSTGVAVSQGTTSNASVVNSPGAGVGSGGAATIGGMGPRYRHPPVNVVFVENSSAVAISQGSGSATSVVNSSNAGVGIGGSANTNSTQRGSRGGIGNIAVVTDSQGVAISQGSGAAVAVLNSTGAGVGVGGSTNINQSSQSNYLSINGQTGVAVAQGSGAAVAVVNSPQVGVGVGGSSNIGTNKNVKGQAVTVKNLRRIPPP